MAQNMVLTYLHVLDPEITIELVTNWIWTMIGKR